MKLTKLEVKGFKSFGDRITIVFDEGVTAIVGPNGCGKSNVVDAIRWVLGEQSTRALRSEKMENVIFNGSQSRKPGNLAEVSLSFDNSKGVLASEFTELTLTRKLYRSGESEYRLNDVACRLKDITDLFLDTGIGADSYSIIELKMVEEIISNKEGSRRALFEEASGISKYKVRKKQTFSKLKDTEEDLTRVEDLVFEIEKNLKTLESQARRTEKYYRLKDQYRELSVQLAQVRISGFRADTQRLEKQKQDLLAEKLVYQTQIEQFAARIEAMKLAGLHKEKNLITQQKTLNDFKSRIQEFENRKKLKNERVRNLTERRSQVQRELEADHEKLQQTESDLGVLQTRLVPEQAQLHSMEIELPELLSASESASADLDISRRLVEAAQKKQFEHSNLSLQKERELDRIRMQAETLHGEINRNSTDRETREKELAEMSARLRQLDDSLESNAAELRLLNEREEQLGEEIADLELKQDSLRKEVQSQTRILDSRQNEFKLTKSLVDNLEGFPDSIRFLKKNAPWLKSAPLLSDVIFCPENYRVAIENYLESYMNFYVVQGRDEAMRAVQLLGDAEKGRANFFILDAVAGRQAPESEEKAPAENCIPAESVLQVSPEYRPLVSFLFKNTWIRKDSATRTSHAETSSATILDELGRYLTAPHRISGGSVGLFEGKRIGRAKNLEILHAQIREGEAELAASRTREEQVQEELRMKRSEKGALQLRPMRETVNRLSSDASALKARKEQYESFIKSNLDRREDTEAKLAELLSASSSLTPEFALLEEQKNAILLDLANLQADYQLKADSKNAISNRFNQKNISFHQQKALVASLEKDLDYKQAHWKSITDRLNQNRDLQEQIIEDLQQVMTGDPDAEGDITALYAELKDLEKASQELEEEYFASKGQVSQTEQDLAESRRRREHTEVLSQELAETIGRLQLDYHGMKERLSVEFGISSEDLEDMPALPDDFDHESVRQRNEKIKIQLDTFGAINPLAMEAFREMDDRCTFIKTQRDDLLQAKKSLLETIREIDDTAKDKFLESFKLIREHFILVFRSLFNEEDSCDLILSDPDNPLDSDIDIIARPKGKRPLTINQLSGGEKTLTATAILFSLYLLKPAPFCIFDEVDAPLDDTNIDKFNKIIRKFSDSSQFIVVSHNKRTIASTDVIYGITMIEPGISKVVPVDLRQVEVGASDTAA